MGCRLLRLLSTLRLLWLWLLNTLGLVLTLLSRLDRPLRLLLLWLLLLWLWLWLLGALGLLLLLLLRLFSAPLLPWLLRLSLLRFPSVFLLALAFFLLGLILLIAPAGRAARGREAKRRKTG